MDDIGIDVSLSGHHIGSDAITEGAYGFFSTAACDKGSNGEYLKDKCRAVTGVWEPGEMALFVSSLAGRYEDVLASVDKVIEGRIFFIAETPDGQPVASRPGSYNLVIEEYYLTPDGNDSSYALPKALARDAVADLLAKDQQDVTVRFFVKLDAPAPGATDVPAVQGDTEPTSDIVPRGDVSTDDMDSKDARDAQLASVEVPGTTVGQGDTDHAGEAAQHGDTITTGAGAADSENALQQGVAEKTVEEEQRHSDDERRDSATDPEQTDRQLSGLLDGQVAQETEHQNIESQLPVLETDQDSGGMGAALSLGAEAARGSDESHADMSESEAKVMPSAVMEGEKGPQQTRGENGGSEESQTTVSHEARPENLLPEVRRTDEASDTLAHEERGALHSEVSGRSGTEGALGAEEGYGSDAREQLQDSPDTVREVETQAEEPRGSEEDVFIGSFQGL